MNGKRAFTILVVLGVIGTVVLMSARAGLFAAHDRTQLLIFIERVRSSQHMPLVFVVIYSVAAAVGVPVTPLTLAGGVLFGPVFGVCLNWISDMMAACIAFASARVLYRRKNAPERGRFQQREFINLVRLRAIPVVPFSVLNVGSAVYGMRWSTFVTATAIGLLPTTIIYTLFAASLTQGVQGSGRRAFTLAVVSGTGVILITLLPTLLRKKPRLLPNQDSPSE